MKAIKIIFTFFCFSSQLMAGVLYEFEDPNLFLFENDNKIYGYFASVITDPPDYRPHPVACIFLLESLISADLTKEIAIRTFYTQSSFNKREYPDSDIFGKMVLDQKTTSIMLDRQVSGCHTAAGRDFSKENGGFSSIINKKSPASGIYTVSEKACIYTKKGNKFYPGRDCLVKGSIVIAMDKKSDFNHIFLSDPKTLIKKYGWVKSDKLANPFNDSSRN